MLVAGRAGGDGHGFKAASLGHVLANEPAEVRLHVVGRTSISSRASRYAREGRMDISSSPTSQPRHTAMWGPARELNQTNRSSWLVLPYNRAVLVVNPLLQGCASRHPPTHPCLLVPFHAHRSGGGHAGPGAGLLPLGPRALPAAPPAAPRGVQWRGGGRGRGGTGDYAAGQARQGGVSTFIFTESPNYSRLRIFSRLR